MQHTGTLKRFAIALGWLVAGAGCAQGQFDQGEPLVHPGGPEAQRFSEDQGQALVRPPAALPRHAAMAQVDDDVVTDAGSRDRGDSSGWSPAKPLTINGRMAQRCRQVRPVLTKAAQAAGLDGHLLLAIAWVESGFNPEAQSGSGAQGVMQLVPRTAAAFGCEDPGESRCAATAAAAYLTRLLRQFDGDLVYALSAYHMGGVHARKAWRDGNLPSDLSYAERISEARARLERYGCDGQP